EKAAAEQIAALLGRAVQTSIALNENLKLKDSGDAERVALAALGARLVAAQYVASGGKIPGDADVARIGTAVDAVLSFADNFMPGAEGRARLEMLDAGSGAALDETQLAVQYVAALLPVVNAVAAFSFGRVEKKLVQDIADRLSGDAEDLLRDIVGDGADAATARRAELQCLRMLAEIYAACHRAETAHLGTLAPADREKIAANGQIPMEPVWESYALRLSMLSVLGAGGVGQAAASSAGPRPVAAAPVVPPAPVAPPAPPAAPAEEAPAGNANPMSFFAKKGDSSQAGG
ncbi:MAG: hypothetical protein KKA05_01240, partial [Alphaproteobacteria bacterium]|nr:hypothetical protein [Alphaproteobacteria bacterium]